MPRSLVKPFQPGKPPKKDHRGGAVLEVDGRGLTVFSRGEFHDAFDLGDHLLRIATDRVGVNGVILRDGIPDKGTITNQLSKLWFDKVKHICPNHRTEATDWPAALKHERQRLEPRSMLVRKATAIPVECTVRGYMTRRAFNEFLGAGTVGGREVGAMLRSERLPEPRLVPSRRENGMRVPMTVAEMAGQFGSELTARLEQTSIAIYELAEQLARPRDVVIAQTTLRFGWIDDQPHLIGDCITPDSSSYWNAEKHRPGGGPARLGKGFLLEELGALGWDGSAPGPRIPEEVIARVRNHYVEAYARITGDRTHLNGGAGRTSLR